MKINPRARPVSRATTELILAIHEISDKHDLTTNELMQILTETTYKLFRRMVREEQQSEE